MVTYQSVGCQLEAVCHYCRSVGLVTQNDNFDSNLILDKNRDSDIYLTNCYSTT